MLDHLDRVVTALGALPAARPSGRWAKAPIVASMSPLLLVVGCDPAPGTPDAAAREELRAGADVEWTVGGVEELSGVLLVNPPMGGAVSPSGSVALADPDGPEVQVLAPNGTSLVRMNRRGDGPGEFRQPWQVGFLGDTLVWVTDVGHGRVNWFEPDGTLVEDLRIPWEPIPGGPWSAGPWKVLSDGAVLGMLTGGGPIAEGYSGPPLPVPLWPVASSGSVRELLIPHRREVTAPIARPIRMADGRHVGSQQPLAADPIVAVEADGRWFFVLDRTPAGSTDRSGVIRIVRFEPSGAVIDTIRIAYEPRSVTGALREELRAEAQQFVQQMPQHLGLTAEAVFDATWIPDALPPVREAYADSRGFWLLRERDRSGLIERYDLEGALVAWAELPSGFFPLAARHELILGYGLDSLSVPLVSKLRIRW